MRRPLFAAHVDVRAFVERSEVTGKDGGPIEVEDLSKFELAKRIAYALRRAVLDQILVPRLPWAPD